MLFRLITANGIKQNNVNVLITTQRTHKPLLMLYNLLYMTPSMLTDDKLVFTWNGTTDDPWYVTLYLSW